MRAAGRTISRIGRPPVAPAQGATTLWKNIEMPQSMMDCFPEVQDAAAQAAAEGFQSTQMFVER